MTTGRTRRKTTPNVRDLVGEDADVNTQVLGEIER
jgi:hypothetical protein